MSRMEVAKTGTDVGPHVRVIWFFKSSQADARLFGGSRRRQPRPASRAPLRPGGPWIAWRYSLGVISVTVAAIPLWIVN